MNAVVKEPETRFIFGSSSSVYGERSGEQFLETDRVDQPLSPYAASKASAELACYSAHHSYGLPVVSLRFFTVYGPRQRPDLAVHKFCKRIKAGEPIEVYGDGNSKRDYTFVHDIVDGIESALKYDCSGFDIINLGRSEPVVLLDMIKTIEKHLKKQAKLDFKDAQIGDVPYTYANIDKARKLLGYNPTTSFDEGIGIFTDWFLKQPLRLKAIVQEK
jgi:UDP-glucuronate 4-epimerase